MNKELKAKWIAALRSGEYPQTRQALRDDQGFCCLGVLCEVAGIPRFERDCGYDFGDPHQGEEAMLFGDLADQIPNQDKLAKLNDDEGASFAVIADWIEQHIPEDAS